MAATTVDTLLVRVEADLSRIRRDLKNLEQTTARSSSRMTSAMQKFGRAVGPILSVVTVVAAGKASLAMVKLASDVEEMQAKSGVVFGDFAEGVRKDLAVFADEVGRSRFELEGMAASIQDTFVPMGFARGEAAQLSVQLAKLATDVASFNNASDTETMAAFQSALVGNHETVRRFGIVITEGTLKQELLRMGITKSAKEVSNAEKVQARLNLIMAGTTDAQGDAARTAESFANRTKALNAELELLGVELGQTLMPVFLAITNRIIKATNAFRGFLKTIGVTEMSTAEKSLKNLEKATEDLIKTRERAARLKAIAPVIEDQEKNFLKIFPNLLKMATNNLDTLALQGPRLLEEAKIIELDVLNLVDSVRMLELSLRDLSDVPVATAITPEIILPKPRPSIPERDADKILKNLKEENAVLDMQAKTTGSLGNALVRFIEIKQDSNNLNVEDLNLIGKQILQSELLQQKIELQNRTREQNVKALEAQQVAQENIVSSLSNLVLENDILEAKTEGATEAQVRFLEISSQLPTMNKEQEATLKALIERNIELDNTLNDTGETVKVFGEVVSNATKELTKMAGSVGLSKLSEEMQATLSFIERFPNATAAEIEEFQRLNETQNNVASTLNDNVSPAMQSALKFIEEMATDTDRLRLIELGLIEAFLEGIITLEQYEEALEALRVKTADMLDSVHPLQEELAKAMKSMSSSISSSLADMVVDGEFSLDSLQNIFESFVKRMIAKAFELFVINKIMNSAFSAMTGGGSLGLDTLSFASGGAINAKASGGAVRSPVLVGERGPELFVPHSAGVIRNAHDTRGMMGGGGSVTINQTLNVETGVAQTVRSELANFAPILKQDTIRAVMEARRRGGQFANAFGG